MAIMRSVQLRRCSRQTERPLHISRFAVAVKPPQDFAAGHVADEDSDLSIQRAADPRPADAGPWLREGVVTG